MREVKLQLKPAGYQIEESYKALRTNLQFCGEDKKIIVVTSCSPDEGKSSVCLRLATELAKSGKRTVLLDADMRKSVMVGRTNAGHDEVKGLAHYLSGQAELADIICATDQKKLYMIYSGPFPPNPSELLANVLFEDLLAALRNVYDYVIVDTPSLGSVIDGAIVAQQADGAVLVIEEGVVSYHYAREIMEQLSKAGCPILGAILNKVDFSKRGSRYGKDYGAYYGDDRAAENAKSAQDEEEDDIDEE